MILFKYLKVT